MAKLQKITASNIYQLQEIGTLGRGMILGIHWLSSNAQFIVVAATTCWKHERRAADQSSKIADFAGASVTASAISALDVLAVAINGLSTNPEMVRSTDQAAEIRLYDAESGNAIAQLLHQPYKIIFLQFSPSGKFLVSSDMETTLIWDVEHQKAVVSIPRAVHAIAFNTDETEIGFIVARSWKVPLKVYTLQIETGEIKNYPHATLEGHLQAAIGYSAGGFVVGSCFKSHDGTKPHEVLITNLSTGDAKVVIHLTQRWPWIDNVIFGNDGTFMISHCMDQKLTVFDTITFVPVSMIQSPETIRELALSSDGKYLAALCSRRVIYVWEVKTGTLVTTLREDVSSNLKINISPDSKQIVGWDGSLHIWDRETGALMGKYYENSDFILDFMYTPSGDQLVTGHYSGAAIVHNMAIGTQYALTPDHPFGVHSLAISSDGRLIAAGGTLGAVAVWDAESRQQIAILLGDFGQKNYVQGLAFHPNNVWLASGDNYGKLRLWDVRSFEQIAIFTEYWGHSRLMFSTRDPYLVSADQSYNRYEEYKDQSVSRIQLWSVPDLEPIHHFDYPNMINPKAKFSPDGQSLAIAIVPHHVRSYPSKEIVRIAVTIHMISMDTMEKVFTLEHLPDVESGSFDFAFSADGSMLFYEDGYDIVVWDLVSREKKIVLRSANLLLGLAADPQSTLIVGRNFSTISVWGIPQEDKSEPWPI